MNSRGRCMVDLVKKDEQHQSCATTPDEKNDDRPESPVRYNDYTEIEWRFLNNLYHDVFPPSQAEEDKTNESLANSSHDIVLGSEENTPMPSPVSGQDLNFGSPLTEVPVDAVNEESTPEPLLPSGRDHCETTPIVTDHPVNIPSLSSLISVSDTDCCDSPTSSTSRKRKPTFKTDPGRKRKRHVKEWVDVRRKVLTNSGQQYISKKGKAVPAKTMKQPCPPTCKLQCTKHFTEDIRKNIFDQFWRLSDHSKQWDYINKFTKKSDKKRMTTENPSRRKFTTKYYLPLPANESTHETQQVCLKMFCGTLAITDQTIRTAHGKLDASGVTSTDNRGKHENHPKKIDDEMIRSVCDHVKSFQPVESHYTRKNTSKLYLDNSLSFNKMFSMYKDWSELSKYNNKAETERQYRNIINDHMNVAFFFPKKDLCDKCHAFSNEISPTEEQVLLHNKHISNKETARKYKAKDKEEAIQNESKTVCATFDFQKLLNCPSGEVSLFYYKRKLSLMHFTVFDTGIKEASCYLWPQNIGKRGANEVGSCLLDFIEKKVAIGAIDIRFWSDNCNGQNRNRVIYSLYMYASNKYNVDITHRFLESGHTQQEADSVHALIERCAKGKIIYTPDQWYALVRWAKTNNKPYNVIEVSQDMFYDLKELLQHRNFKKNTSNQDVKWNYIKEICVKSSEPDVILYKYDLDSDYLRLNTLVQTRRKKKTAVATCNDALKPLYLDRLPIPEAKYKDLMSLCEAGHIPRQYHDFFKSLKRSLIENISGSDSDE